MEQEREVTPIHTRLEDGSGIIFDPISSSTLKDTEEYEKLDTKSIYSGSDEESDENEDDFTFACATDDELSFAAEDIFDNGKIKPVFPLFDQSLVDLPPVKKIFTVQGSSLLPAQSAAESSGEATSSRHAVEVDSVDSAEACKKSNSTGFSKIWRFKEMATRSHSDGRDAFVFLKKPASKKKTKDSTPVVADQKSASTVVTKKKSEKTKDSVSIAADKSAATVAMKKKGGGKGKEATTAISVHEAYMKSKAAAAREEDRRRPYLQYKPVGFFTNIHGTMTKNVHPF